MSGEIERYGTPQPPAPRPAQPARRYGYGPPPRRQWSAPVVPSIVHWDGPDQDFVVTDGQHVGIYHHRAADRTRIPDEPTSESSLPIVVQWAKRFAGTGRIYNYAAIGVLVNGERLWYPSGDGPQAMTWAQLLSWIGETVNGIWQATDYGRIA